MQLMVIIILQYNSILMDLYSVISKLTPKSIKTFDLEQAVTHIAWFKFLTAEQKQLCQIQIKLLKERYANLKDPNYVEPKSFLQRLVDWFDEPYADQNQETQTSKPETPNYQSAKNLLKHETQRYNQKQDTDQTEPLSSDKDGTIFQTYKSSQERIKKNK